MTPHSKSSSDSSARPSQQHQQLSERPRSSSSDAKLPSIHRYDAQSNHSNKSAGIDSAVIEKYNLVRCKSDTTSSNHIYNNTLRRQLQTITSGIALDEMKSPTQSLPPLSPAKGSHSPQCPHYHHKQLARRKSLPNETNPGNSPQLPRKTPPQSPQYYQLRGQLPPCMPSIDSFENPEQTMTHRSQNSHSSFDPKQGTFMQQLRANHLDHGDDNDSAVADSIVFHYTAGEIPPAEYALPASILQVYGVDCECYKEGMDVEYPSHVAERLASSLTNSSSENLSDVPKNGTSHLEPSMEHVSANRYELLPPDNQYHNHNVPEQPIILPYHERKRLSEFKEKEEKRAARKESKLAAAKTREGKTEKSALKNTPASTKYDYDQNQAPGFKLFGQLAALITGTQEDHSQDQQETQYGSIEDVSKVYRDRGNAFIQKTQKQRTKFREQCKSDELNNVTIPVSTLVGPSGHSRAKMSSLSNALDSIADCNNEDEETGSSDEETESSYYDSESYSNTTESTKKVWKYGEPSVTSKTKRDRKMERERLLQEEYEFRLRRLTKENEILAKKFRLFVLVTVAFILVAALSFAIMLCVKMLLLG